MMISKIKIMLLLGVLVILLMFISITSGEIDIKVIEVLKGLFSNSTDYNNSLITNLRMPRVVAGACIGASLSVSGLLSSVALKNPLADSGILGIQSGATVGALFALLIFPAFIKFLPIFAFLGGFTAFGLLLLINSGAADFKPSRVILIGVAINSIGTSLIGIITILNVYKIRNAMSWLSGSLTGISKNDMNVIGIYSLVFLGCSIVLIPVLKILLLEDSGVVNLGYNPGLLRIIVCVFAVMLASIGVAYAGIIAFIGIIAPQLARRLVGQNFSYLLPASALVGAILVVSTDLFQKMIFAPLEIPVGILIGILGAPLFIILAKGK